MRLLKIAFDGFINQLTGSNFSVLKTLLLLIGLYFLAMWFCVTVNEIMGYFRKLKLNKKYRVLNDDLARKGSDMRYRLYETKLRPKKVIMAIVSLSLSAGLIYGVVKTQVIPILDNLNQKGNEVAEIYESSQERLNNINITRTP